MEYKTLHYKDETEEYWGIKLPHPTCRALFYNMSIRKCVLFEEWGFSVSFTIITVCEVDEEKELVGCVDIDMTKEEFKKLIEIFERAYNKIDKTDFDLQVLKTYKYPIGWTKDLIYRTLCVVVSDLDKGCVKISIDHKYKNERGSGTIVSGIPILLKKEDFKKLIEMLKETYKKWEIEN